MANVRVGIDIGGTFTDLIALDDENLNITIVKVPSRPGDPAEAAIDAIKKLCASNPSIRPNNINFFCHGTTVATNALLELKGAKTGLLVTEGFRGIYEVRTQSPGTETHNIFFEKPPMLVPERLTEEIRERMTSKGEILIPLDETDVKRAAATFKKNRVESVAICYLFSFLNPIHELKTEEIIKKEYPEVYVSSSAKIAPLIREYHRLSTTVLDAYVASVIRKYLDRMKGLLKHTGIVSNKLFVIQSSGGLMTFDGASNNACRTLLSGPAGGVMGALSIGEMTGYKNLVTFDMGGTSADIALTIGGKALETKNGVIAGQAITVPMIDVKTIGAGGGTIAWVSLDGLLKVGPQSAGADPGPACYGKNGTKPTVTDANVVLGYINPKYLLGGALPLDKSLSQKVIKETGDQLGLDDITTAEGIIRIINAKMEIEIRKALLEMGYDPRNFVLVAFGGAGPVHAGRLAKNLKIPKVIVPLWPGITSAMGLLVTDVKHDYIRSSVQRIESADINTLNSLVEELEKNALEEMEAEGFKREEVNLLRYFDLRYAAQAYEIMVPIHSGKLREEDRLLIRRDFDRLHEEYYGVKAESEPVDLVNCRILSMVKVPKLPFKKYPTVKEISPKAIKEHRQAFFPETKGYVAIPVYDRDQLMPGNTLRGPCIVEQLDTTTVIYPNQSAEIDEYRNIIIETDLV